MPQKEYGRPFPAGGSPREDRFMTFGELLTSARSRAGITVYRLAILSGISQQYIARVERDEQQPSIGVALCLLTTINVALATAGEEGVDLGALAEITV